MTDHTDCKRAYMRFGKTWYAKSYPDDYVSVMVGMYHPDGGTSGEFEIEWVPLENNKLPSARLKSFEDSWSALWLFKDLLEKMSEVDSKNIQEPEFCHILDSLGIIDITEYERGIPKNNL